MNYKNTIMTILGVLFLSIGILVSGCTEGQRIEPGSDTHDMVIARVGDKDITLADLLEKPRIYQIIHDDLIIQEIIRQEASKRGISPDNDVIQEQIDAMIEGSGGYDAFMEQVGGTMPEALVPNDVRKFFIMQHLQMLIMDNEFETTQLPLSDEEMLGLWEERKDRYVSQYVFDHEGVENEDVTMEMCVTFIETAKKDEWMQLNAQTFLTDIEVLYDIENVLLDSWSTSDFVIVPLVPDEEDETHDEEAVEEEADVDEQEEADVDEQEEAVDGEEAGDGHSADDGHGH